MSEEEWLACVDPQAMLTFLGKRGSDRQRRLFGCACVRQVWDLLIDERSRRAVEVAERHADRRAQPAEVRVAFEAAEQAADDVWGRRSGDPADARTELLVSAAEAATDLVSGQTGRAVASSVAASLLGRGNEQHLQAALLRDVFGNPFRPLPARSFPPEVVALAKRIYAGDHSGYAALADALDRLGETSAAAHCREPLHAKGCHALDWVLAEQRGSGAGK